MTSRLVEIPEENVEKKANSKKRRWAWTGFKLGLAFIAVYSFYSLNQSLNAMGCRFAVNTGLALSGTGFIGFKQVLNHRFTGYLLDTAYIIVLLYIIFSSWHGMQDLENGGCTQYFEQNTDVEITDSTRFMNNTEYENWKEKQEKEAEVNPQNLNLNEKSFSYELR